jgi:hypothetical protein
MSITSTTCCNCHVPIYMEERVMSELRSSRKTFFCINGHNQHFTGKTEVEIERDALRVRAERAEREAADARARASRIELEARREKNRCEHCPKRFDTPEKLRAHIKRIHTKVPRLPANAGESN